MGLWHVSPNVLGEGFDSSERLSITVAVYQNECFTVAHTVFNAGVINFQACCIIDLNYIFLIVYGNRLVIDVLNSRIQLEKRSI